MPEIIGFRTWDGGIDEAGHRTYFLTVRVEGDRNDGPNRIMNTPGLPAAGSVWAYGSDFDPYAWRRPEIKCEKEKGYIEGDPTDHWDVTFTFSTKPLPQDKGGGSRCSDHHIEDPLMEPPTVSGSFVKYTEEGVLDRHNVPILSSSFEQLRGPQNEWDANRPQIKVTVNVPVLNLATVAGMVDHVNSSSLWGLPPRTIKLSDATWKKQYYGLCYTYYTWDWTFDINYGTWDRELQDYGTKALRGHWDLTDGSSTAGDWILDRVGVDSDGNDISPDPNNPLHFDRFKDRNGENIPVILDGRGRPYGVDVVDDNGMFLMSLVNGSGHTEPGDTSDPTKWIRLTTNPRGTIPKWKPNVNYNQGVLRQARTPGTATFGPYTVWVQTRARGSTGVPGVAAEWFPIAPPTGMAARYKGAYVVDEFNLYNYTDIVSSALRTTTGMGMKRVEKYNEADFTLLGIPLDF